MKKLFALGVLGLFFLSEPTSAQIQPLGTPGYESVDEDCGGGSVMRCRWNDLSSCSVEEQELCD